MIKKFWSYEHAPHILVIVFLMVMYYLLVSTTLPDMIVRGSL